MENNDVYSNKAQECIKEAKKKLKGKSTQLS